MSKSLTIALANSGRKWIGEVAHVASLYEQFEALGHRPWLICRRGKALEAHALEKGWRHLSLEFNGHWGPLCDWRDYRRWLDWGRREQVDILHCHRGKDHWLGYAVARSLKLPLVRTRHVVIPIHHHPINRWFYLKATGAVVSVSEAAQASFGNWKDQLPLGRVILSGVDIQRFHPAGRSETWRTEHAAPAFRHPAGLETEPDASPLWFGLIGRLQNIKGHHIFMEAAAQVARQCPNAHFLIAGQGSDARGEKLRQQARDLGFDKRFVIEGYLPEIEKALASLDVGVIASLGSEGSSRVALEMMASGLPLVSSRVGGIPDLVEGKGVGRLVPPGDPEALAQAMLALAKDRTLRLRQGQAARRHVLEHHQLTPWAESMLEVYRQLLGDAAT